MAALEHRKTKSGERWRVKWRQSGRWQSETFDNQEAATRFRKLVEGHGNQWPSGWTPGVGYEADTRLTVFDWCVRAINARKIEDETRKDYLSIIDRRLGSLAYLPIADVTVEQARLWLNSLDGKPKTVANIHGLVSSCFNDAVADGHCERNPLKGLVLPRSDGPDAHEMVILDEWQVRLILTHMSEHYRPFVWFLYTTGARLGEASALPVGNVDVFARKARIDRAHKRQPGGDQVGPPKTVKGNRTVGLTRELTDMLIPLVAGKRSTDLVFENHNGYRIRHNHWRSEHWWPAVQRANVCDFHWGRGETDPCGCEGTLGVLPRPHDLRHSHASRLIDAGIEPMKIQYRLGHESIKTTYDTYGGLFPRAEEEILAVLESKPPTRREMPVEDRSVRSR